MCEKDNLPLARSKSTVSLWKLRSQSVRPLKCPQIKRQKSSSRGTPSPPLKHTPPCSPYGCIPWPPGEGEQRTNLRRQAYR